MNDESYRSPTSTDARTSRDDSAHWTGCVNQTTIATMDAISVPQSMWEIGGRLGLAALLGAAIGINREWERKPAGLRTHALVALGGALFTLIGLFLHPDDPSATGRILQGITAGIGFIGAGVIMRRPELQDVQGLTTAAAIWVVAAIGVAVGAGLWRTGLIALALALFVLVVGDTIDRWLHRAKNSD
jgi:putative Mg2+ transporter-C (MgtC) family protein